MGVAVMTATPPPDEGRPEAPKTKVRVQKSLNTHTCDALNRRTGTFASAAAAQQPADIVAGNTVNQLSKMGLRQRRQTSRASPTHPDS
jgi:hypothetical protein